MDQTEYKRLQSLLEPCQTPDELDAFLRNWLKLDLPWDTVDPDSTSAPLKFIWSVYKSLLTGKGDSRHVVAASRNSFKTLNSSVLQFLSMLHFRRDAVQLAAILDQSMSAIAYLDNFLKIPELAPYKKTDSVRTKMLMNLPPNDYTKIKNSATLSVITATKKSANSKRCSFAIFDEVDLTPKEILSEVSFVIDPTRDEHRFDPVIVYLSSRKSNDGPIQDLMDEALQPVSEEDKSLGLGIRLHRWSSADMMEKCPEEIHKPELGTRKAFMHTESLSVIWDEDNFKKIVSPGQESAYKEIHAYEGCVTCPAFVACQGYSANQKGDAPTLRDRKFTAKVLRTVKDPNFIVAQMLNWKPESTGLVFRTFAPHKHLKDPINFWEFAFNERYNPRGVSLAELDRIEELGDQAELKMITPNKDQIYAKLVSDGWDVGIGVDFGVRDTATAIVGAYHKRKKRMVFIHRAGAKGFANHLWADWVATNVCNRFPADFVAPDCADAAAPSYFAKHKIPALSNKPHQIETGVSFIRGHLFDPATQMSHFAILDDSGLEGENFNHVLVDSFAHWAHKKNPVTGYDLTKFDDNHYCDDIDPCRYLLNPFIEKHDITINVDQDIPYHQLPVQAALGNQEAIDKIRHEEQAKTIFYNQLRNEHGYEENPFTDSKKSGNTKGAVKFRF